MNDPSASPPPPVQNGRGARGKSRRWLTILAGVAALSLVAGYFLTQKESVGQILAMTRPLVLLAAVATYWVYMALRTLRMGVLLGEHAPRFRELFYLQCLTGGLGTLSPGRIGEAVKVEWLRRSHGVPLERALLAYGVEKSQDVGFYAAAALASVWVLGSLEIVPEWLRGSFLTILGVLLLGAFVVLVIHLWRSASALGHMGLVIGMSALVFCGAFGTCYVVFAMHGLYAVGPALAINSLTVVAGTLSMLPGGGQGVVQFAFHHAATGLFHITEETTLSMVLHITASFYLGVATSCLLAVWLRPSQTPPLRLGTVRS